MIADVHVDDARGVGDPGPTPIRPRLGSGFGGLGLGHRDQSFNQFAAVAMQANQVRKLAVEAVEEDDLAAAGFVEDLDLDPLAEGRPGTRLDPAGVLDARAVADVVVGDMQSHVGDAGAIANRAVGDERLVDSTRLLDGAVAGNRPAVGSDPHVAEELGVSHGGRVESIGDLHPAPVGGGASLGGEGLNLGGSQRAIGSIGYGIGHERCLTIW